ncbi:Fungal transcriptional regulatory protein, N-terminal [Penicillium camemberti]|uniref:Fungal transcriptional regulatory protein, N-terminal n=1 Tax=Penicillium camemberti (strain FM 013) TaxID=1429867 RepID=A0A0G4NTM1_PENC3|nr:Fungal transcriptional regulatory protein, N-terminal [Penicillium camemberti]
MSEASDKAQPGWRIPRACQECRKRKIKCNGLTPCKTCQLRNTPCIYRDYIRHRRKKHEHEEVGERNVTRQGSPSGVPPSGQRTASVMNDFPNSVSATHTASPSCQMQLYYGPTSHFSLMQHIYRDLVSNPTSHPEPSGGVEEAGAGLDLFSFRRIFFGTPDFHESNKSPGKGDLSMMFLPYDLARLFLSRFLSSLYHLIPLRPKPYYEQCLDRLYNSSPADHLDAFTQAILLLAMASASLGTEHFAWGDVLFERVKTSLAAFDDVVNLQTIQISLYANYQNEQGRPNSTFLHLGSAARKALSAGLHKDVPHDVDQTPENIEERRVTFWSLYIYETWFCFHVGRPNSLSLKDAAIEYPQDPFIRLLVQLCKSITRSVNEIYGQRHESLLHMWKVARSIANDIRGNEAHLQQALGLGLDDSIQAGSLGVRQIIFITLYHHTMLLTFRPFLVFRGHWQRERNIALNQSTTNVTNRPRETPSWLNEACNHAITAAQRTLHHLCEASRVNNLVLELRYHGYFFGNSVFTLIYEFIHNPSVAPLYLPWVYASLQTLSTMRAGDPIASSISAMQTVLRNINPSYEWVPPLATTGDNFATPGGTPVQQGLTPDRSHQSQLNNPAIPQNPSLGMRPGILTSPWNFPQVEKLENPETGGSAGSGDDLLDFTQSDMGWNFDFSTMDLDAFFSVYQSNDAPVS